MVPIWKAETKVKLMKLPDWEFTHDETKTYYWLDSEQTTLNSYVQLPGKYETNVSDEDANFFLKKAVFTSFHSRKLYIVVAVRTVHPYGVWLKEVTKENVQGLTIFGSEHFTEMVFQGKTNF